MDTKLKEKIQKALLSLKDRDVLSAINKNITGFVKAKDEDYDSIREIIDTLKIQ